MDPKEKKKVTTYIDTLQGRHQTDREYVIESVMNDTFLKMIKYIIEGCDANPNQIFTVYNKLRPIYTKEQFVRDFNFLSKN